MKTWTVFLFLFLNGNCYPQERYIIPQIQLTNPQEVNSLASKTIVSRSINVPESTPNNIEDTVKEVESIIKANPALPRLTRGEILDILENITKSDAEKAKVFQNNLSRDPKAIMVVMPFTPSSGDDNMQELFTKAPVTQIIGAEPFAKTEQTKKPTVTSKPTRSRYTVRRTTTPPSTTTSIYTTRTPRPTRSRYDTPLRRRRPEATTQATTTTTIRSRTRGPNRGRRPTQRYPNHRYPEETTTSPSTSTTTRRTIPTHGIKIVNPPRYSYPEDINDSLPDLYLEEDNRKEIVYSPPKLISADLKKDRPIVEEINVPEHLRPVAAQIDLDNAVKPQAQPKPFSPIPSTELSEQDRLKAMLAELGVQPPPTTTSMPDVKNVADNLSPDMRELLMNFGLIPDTNPQPEVKQEGFYPERAEVDPESYVGFKPLPEDNTSQNEMNELLARFGLGRNSRKQKAIVNNRKEMSFDMVPENYKHVLTEIGLTKEAEPEKKSNVFNPADSTQYASDEEILKLNKLLEMIKELEKLNGTVTEEDLKKIDLENLKELVGTFNNQSDLPLSEQRGPSPIDYDVGINKNEIKRQEPSTTSEAPTTTTTTTSSSLKDLEDSFGGQSESSTEATLPETTTQGRRSGFYYLLDWNSFLDIDDQKGKRVNLRFQPKAGDPNRFLSVTVP